MKNLEVNLLLVSDREIRKYNRIYLRQDSPTDVISFPMREKGMLGDILISADAARRQARELGHSVLTEMKILAIHGILHLLGFRDKNPRDRKRMWKKTDELMGLVRGL